MLPRASRSACSSSGESANSASDQENRRSNQSLPASSQSNESSISTGLALNPRKDSEVCNSTSSGSDCDHLVNSSTARFGFLTRQDLEAESYSEGNFANISPKSV